MSDQKQRDFGSVMARLRANYLASLPGKADALAESLSATQSGDAEAAESLAQQIHRLAGTAGSFGIHDISEMANALDIRLHNGEQPSDLNDEIQAFVAALRARSSSASS